MELPIRSVRVHRDGARVTRCDTVSPDGSTLVVTGLPLLLDPSSLEVGTSLGAPTAFHLEVDLPFRHRAVEGPLHRQHHQVVQQLRFLRDEIEHVTQMVDVPASLTPDTGPGHRLGPMGLTHWLHLQRALQNWTDERVERLRRLSLRGEHLEEERTRLEASLRLHSTENHWNRWAPTHRLTIELPSTAPCDITLRYHIRGATWEPVYQLDVEPGWSTARLSARARISQSTGEDWNHVNIDVSTTSLTREVTHDKLPALRLGERAEQRPSGFRPLPDNLDDLFEGPAPTKKPAPTRKPAQAPANQRAEEYAPPPPKPMLMRSAAPPSRASAPRRRSKERSAPKIKAQAPTASLSLDDVGASPPPGFGGGGAYGAVAQDPEPSRIEVDQLDYGTLWLHGPDHRRRGRLWAPHPSEHVKQSGAPPEATRRWDRVRRTLLDQAERLPKPTFEGRPTCWSASRASDVASDGQARVVHLFSTAADLSVRHLTVAREEPKVYRKIEARMDRSGGLLPGPIDILVGGRLELSRHLDGSAGDTHLHLGLGEASDLTVVRNVRYEESSAGLLGGSRMHTTHVETLIRSTASTPVRVEVLDRLPVPADINAPAIVLGASSPNAEPYGGEPLGPELSGGRRQFLTVPPGGEARASFSYSIKLGNRQQLNGGDRRA